jgi:hypothetical protein
MEHTVDNLSYSLTPLDGENTSSTDVGKLRIVINKGDQELGSLYYEKVKKTFNRKPIGMNAWGCVDAKIEGLYEAEENITPTEVMNICQSLIREAGY